MADDLVARLTAVLERAGVESVTREGGIWDLHEPGLLGGIIRSRSEFSTELRRRILGVIAERSQNTFLLSGEEVPESLRAELTPIALGIWSVGRPQRIKDILGEVPFSWGNWVLLVADHSPQGVIPDIIRASPQDVVHFMEQNRVTALIDSFHDDREWRVAVRRTIMPPRTGRVE